MLAGAISSRSLSSRAERRSSMSGRLTLVMTTRPVLFALAPLQDRPLRVSLKCEPALADQLRSTYAAVRPGYHLNKRH